MIIAFRGVEGVSRQTPLKIASLKDEAGIGDAVNNPHDVKIPSR
jgi:hypothetical protein